MKANKRTASEPLWICAILIGLLALSSASNIGCMDGPGPVTAPPNSKVTIVDEGDVETSILGLGESRAKWKRTTEITPITPTPTTQPAGDADDGDGGKSGGKGNGNGAEPVSEEPTTTPPTTTPPTSPPHTNAPLVTESSVQATSLMGDKMRGDVIVDVVIDDMRPLMQEAVPLDTPVEIKLYGLPVDNLPETTDLVPGLVGTHSLRVRFITDGASMPLERSSEEPEGPTGPFVDVHVSGTFLAVTLWMREAGFLWIEVADGRPETAGAMRTRIDFFPPGDPNGSRLQVERGYIEPHQIEVYPLAP